MRNEERNINAAVCDEVELSPEMQAAFASACEKVPAKLYSSVMAKIEIEKKKKKAKLIRTIGTSVAAVFIFAIAAIYIFPKVSEGMVADNFSPSEAAYNKGKAIEDADAEYHNDVLPAPAEPEIGDVMLCRVVFDAAPEINGQKKPLAEYQSGKLLVVKDGNGYYVSDMISADKVYLSTLVADISRAEKYLSSKYNKEITFSDSNNFCLAPQGIQILGEYIFPWSMIPEEIFVKYDFANAPLIESYLDDSEYEKLTIRQTQD